MAVKYKIGTAARLFGITPQSVRFYENEHLLMDKDSGATRFYTAREFKRLTSVRRYIKMGFGTREIREMFDQDQVAGLNRIIRAKKQETYEQIARLHRTMYALDQYEQGLELIGSLYERCEVNLCPEMLIFINQHGQTLIENADVERQLQNWSEHFDIISSMTYIPRELLQKKKRDAQRDSGYCIPLSTARLFHLEYDPAVVKRVEPVMCLHSVVCVQYPDSPVTEYAAAILKMA